MTWAEKLKRGLLEGAEERREEMIRVGWLPEGVERVGGWEEVVRWVRNWERKKGEL